MSNFSLPEFVDKVKLVDNLANAFPPASGAIDEHLREERLDAGPVWEAVRDSLAIGKLVENLSEAFRLPADDMRDDLKVLGFHDLILQDELNRQVESPGNGKLTQSRTYDDPNDLNPFTDLFRVHAQPGLVDPMSTPNDRREDFLHGLESDPLRQLYREGVMEYFEDYMRTDALKIREYIEERFDGGHPKYLVTTGIGANEQFNHFVASINNKNSNRRLTWLVVNSPKRLSLLPDDANLDNTLFMEFSRSSLTEETVKIHEYTPRDAHRIVYCNSGPLLELGRRDGNLIQTLPDQVSGRYGRNKTPILLAPMDVAGMDVEAFWRDANSAVKGFDVCALNSLPVVIAEYLFQHQMAENRNLIYLGCNDDDLVFLADEFVQYWNEGVNKDGNDLLVSRFFGLPRDSHMNAEGILGNRDSKMALFVLRTNMRGDTPHTLVSPTIDPINAKHGGLHFGDEEAILAYANYKRFAELMPTILLEIPSEPSLRHAAIVGQLFADITYAYAHRIGTNPGSNPEVKAVRERSADLLSETAEKVRNGRPIQEAVAD
jgi:hypothetical protein